MPSPTFLPLSTRSVDVHFVRVMSKTHTIAIMGPATAAAFDFLKQFRLATLKMPTWHDENLLTPRQSLQKRGMLALDDVPFEETEEELTKDETHCFEEFLQMWKTHRGGSIVCAEEGEALFQKWPPSMAQPAGHTNHEAHGPQSSGEPWMGISREWPFPLLKDAFQNNVQLGNQKMSLTEAGHMKQYYQAYRQAQRSWVRREGAASEVPEMRSESGQPALALGTEVELRMGTPVSPFQSTSDPDQAALTDLRVLCEEMADCAESAVATVWGRICLGLEKFFARRAQAQQAILHSAAVMQWDQCMHQWRPYLTFLSTGLHLLHVPLRALRTQKFSELQTLQQPILLPCSHWEVGVHVWHVSFLTLCTQKFSELQTLQWPILLPCSHWEVGVHVCQTCTPTSHCEHGKRIGRCRVCNSEDFCVHNVPNMHTNLPLYSRFCRASLGYSACKPLRANRNTTHQHLS